MTPTTHIYQTRQSLEQTDKAMDAEIFKQMWIEGDLAGEPKTQTDWDIVNQEIREWERSIGRDRY